jgi:hypothetical protein
MPWVMDTYLISGSTSDNTLEGLMPILVSILEK